MSDTVQGAPDSLAPSTGPSACTLRVVHSPDGAAIGRQVELRRSHALFVGRNSEGGLSVNDARLSKQHFMVAAVRSDLECADVGSRNGTFVDGVQQRATKLRHGSVLRAGDTLFVVSFGDQARRLNDAAKRLAPTDIPVLLQGETGVGKEVMARALHEQSGRRGVFVPVNCATLPRELIASELFGHAKNAFSGATQARAGLFRSADGGTLFLDEVGDLPLELQPALLRALEERKVRPVGADQELELNVRVIAATHVDLERAVAAASFRADLYARLAHVVLRLPPLRERREQLLELAARLAPQLRFSADAAEALLLWHWPRNVRELRALLDVASALVADGTTVRLRDLRDRIHEATERVRHRPAAAGSTPPEASEPHPGVERRERLLALFREHQGNVSKVAAELGTPRAQVYRWLRAAGLEASELRARKA